MLIHLSSLPWLRVCHMVSESMWKKPLPSAEGVAPALTCQFQLDEDKGSRRDFTLACPIAMVATPAWCVLPDRWFPPHFAIRMESLSLSPHATPLLTWPESSRPSGQPVGLNVQIAPDVPRLWRFRISGTSTFKNSALCLGRLGSNSSPLGTPLMWMHRGENGEGKLRRALLVPISLQVALPSRIPAVMWVGANSPYATSDWEAGDDAPRNRSSPSRRKSWNSSDSLRGLSGVNARCRDR